MGWKSKLKRAGRSFSRRVIRPVFNPIKSVTSKINEQILNPTLIKPFEKMDDFIDRGGLKGYAKSMSDLYRAQMLGLQEDQISQQNRTKLQRFLELKGSPKINRVYNINQLGQSMGMAIKDWSENQNAIRLATEQGALNFSKEGEVMLPEGVETFQKFMKNKRLKELEASRGPGPESVESLMGRVQSLGQAGPQTFTPTDTNFSNFLSKIQGQAPQNSGKKGK